MDQLAAQRLAALTQTTLTLPKHIKRGIEKESLRVTPQGYLAQTFHPKALGSKLTHPYITTDFSEALLEFITPAVTDVNTLIQWLDLLHAFTYQHLGEEIIWDHSMPCNLTDEQDIPIADYGTSNPGRMKMIYRHGLAHRYGKRMQTIAGVHFNFSYPVEFWQTYQGILNDKEPLQSFIDTQYFCLIRNFSRLSWLPIYLFGASPAICKSFAKKASHYLTSYDDCTYYGEYATSLRMSDLGYQNDAQAHLYISYNSLHDYVHDLRQAIKTPYEPYQQLGVMNNGEYLQLNDHLLQIEAEYYSGIRAKRVTPSGINPSKYIKQQGVEYIEVRILDINPFSPNGVDEQQLLWLDIFLFYCLIQDSPLLHATDYQQVRQNKRQAVLNGRDPKTLLTNTQGQSCLLSDWAEEIVQDLYAIARWFDQDEPLKPYQSALQVQHEKLKHPHQLPSQMIIDNMQKSNQSYFDFAMDMTKKHQQTYRQYVIADEMQQHLKEAAEKSWEKFEHIENAPRDVFEEYLKKYFAD